MTLKIVKRSIFLNFNKILKKTYSTEKLPYIFTNSLIIWLCLLYTKFFFEEEDILTWKDLPPSSGAYGSYLKKSIF